MNQTKEFKIIIVLAVIQFTNIVDFMIIMPLGPYLMPELGISALEFGWLVGVYSLSSALTSLVGSVFVDRFGRRQLLRFGLGMFALATLACGFASGFTLLLLARMAAGVFGGLLSVVVQTIVGDVVPYERRGKASGVLMAAFSLATIMGVPGGLYIAENMGWQAPFIMLALTVFALLILSWRMIPQLHDHLQAQPVSMPQTVVQILGVKRHLIAFLFMLFLTLAGFIVIPFLTIKFTVNLGLDKALMPWVYLLGGAATLVSAQAIGSASDRFGKQKVFVALAFSAVLPLLWITHTKTESFGLLLLISTMFFVLVTGRMIPAMAMMSQLPPTKLRGGFMSLNFAVQSLGMGLGASLGGWLATNANGDLDNFARNGWLAAGFSLLSILMLWIMSQQSNSEKLSSELIVETDP